MGRRTPTRSGALRRAAPIFAVACAGALLVSACGLFADDEAPLIALVGISSGTVIDQQDVAVVVRVTDDRSEVAAVTIRTSHGTSATCAPGANDRFTCASLALVVGDNQLTVTARDASDNVAELRFVLQRTPPPDDTPPSIVIIAPEEGASVGVSSLPVTADVSDEGGVASVTYATDHGDSGTCAPETESDTWTCGPIPIPVGTTTISVTAIDASDNVAGATVTVTREDSEPIPDVTPPTVEIVDPPDGATVAASEVMVDVVASDEGGVASVSFATDRGASGACTLAFGGGYACGPVPLPVGFTAITVTAEDAAGNSANATITVERIEPADETPPTVAIVDPPDGASVTASEVMLDVVASDDIGVASVSFATDHGASGSCALDVSGGYACGPVPLPLGLTTITVTALDDAGNSGSDAVTVQRVSPPTPAFDIEVVFFDESFTTSQRAAFVDAADRWEELVVGDLEDVTVDLPASGSCGVGEPAYAGTIDDLLIYATSFTDGVGGLLGSAGPCLYRSSGTNAGTNLVGIMRFDTADLADLEAQGALVDVIVHEMGHVLGIGTNWEFPPYFDLLDYLASDGATRCRNAGGFLRDPTFIGTSGVAAWSALGGSGAVPVEETGGPGTQCGHWDEEVFGSELMTGYLNVGGPNPLSAMTVRSLEDIGLTVDPSAADPYALPSGAALRAPDELNLMAAEELLLPRGSVDPATGRVEPRPSDPRGR